MKPGTVHLVLKSIAFNRSSTVYQVLIIILLSAVIAGSLMTGSSIRSSLTKSSSERLGNAGIIVSSGMRYFDPALTGRMAMNTEATCAGLLELKGYCQNFITGKSAFRVNIYGIDSAFFSFHGNDQISVNHGEVAINDKLADYLEVKPGDDLIIRFNNISSIPADAPFAPEQGDGNSVVMKTGRVLSGDQSGNFSLNISQITPMNVFINRSDLTDNAGNIPEINRLLIANDRGIFVDDVYNKLRDILNLEEIGLTVRFTPKTGGHEIISDRVFIDQPIAGEIERALPSAAPVITYLGNSFRAGSNSTPYSFISGLPATIYPVSGDDEKIVINNWLADDLGVDTGDTIMVSWYSPDIANRLVEDSTEFIISQIVDMNSIWADPTLMPEFQGISGSESCSEWDAGVPVNLDLIRKKDEDYWNKYQGTPKAFISYQKGKVLWGSNYGPVTSMRFPADISEEEIRFRLKGELDPYKTGFIITDLANESVRAANEGTDFSTLFLSLGFFVILASLILLVLVVTTHLETKEEQIKTLFALGFTNRWIRRMVFLESGIVALTGSVIGIFAGAGFNLLIINALNSVWEGAVQTNTLTADIAVKPMITGFILSVLIAFTIIIIKSRVFLRSLSRPATGLFRGPSRKKGMYFFLLSVSLSLTLLILSVILPDVSVSLSFSGGALMFISLVLLARQFNIRRPEISVKSFRKRSLLSSFYYSFYPSHSTTPLLFIAAGIFAVIITGVNRMNISDEMLKPSSGTGGYILWCESTVPIDEDLNSEAGKREFALDEDELAGVTFVQVKRYSGDDASCLNLNNVASPPLLGIDPQPFIEKGSFSFATKIKAAGEKNTWGILNISEGNNIIYGVADQTVLQWGLKIKPGDTLFVRAENGQPLKIVIAGGLKASVFQGNIIISAENFNKHFPSVSGNQILLVDGDRDQSDFYRDVLAERFSNYGIYIEPAGVRLASFFEVTNTYLSVFSILGGIGMVLGVIGLGFVLIRNYNQRKRDFALLMATGFSLAGIREIIGREQIFILLAGVCIGTISALLSTWTSLKSGSEIPWNILIVMIVSVVLAGIFSLMIALRAIRSDSLITNLRKE